jgi:hypothetical protein
MKKGPSAMTYPKRFSQAQQTILVPLLEKLHTLKQGEAIRVRYATSIDCSRARYLLHAYLSPLHSNLKEAYRTTRLGDKVLLISKLEQPLAPTITTLFDELPAERLCKLHLAGATTEEEAIAKARTLTQDPQLLTDLVLEWKRTCAKRIKENE